MHFNAMHYFKTGPACFPEALTTAQKAGEDKPMTDTKAGDSQKSVAKKKKAKSTPKKERQISLRLSANGAKRLTKLTETKEWTVTQVIEEALKVYAAHEGITIQDKPKEPADQQH
jgi:hypothetical protein